MKVKIYANTYYLPETKESNDILKQDNPDWDMEKIAGKTGILTRYIASPNQTALDLAFEAGRKLLKDLPNKNDIDLVVLVTQSPDYFLPTSACILQDKLDLPTNCMAFDINLGCSGFIYALSVVGSLIESGLVKNGLILCSDTYSKYIDKSDRACRPIFSDGASATLLVESEVEEFGQFIFGTDGSGFDKLIVKEGAAREPIIKSNSPYGIIDMHGADVFLFTLREVPLCINKLLIKSNLAIKDVDLFIFHQASKLVLDNLIRALSLDENKVFINMKNIGNTVSASIPIALKDAEEKGRISVDDLVMLIGFGVGLSWGATLLTWRGK